jgi:hypothetical protein
VVFAPDHAATFDWFAYGAGSPVKTLSYSRFRGLVDQYSVRSPRRATMYRTVAR